MLRPGGHMTTPDVVLSEQTLPLTRSTGHEGVGGVVVSSGMPGVRSGERFRAAPG
jgi:hypothetical protein